MQRWCTFFTLARKVPARVKSRTHDFRNLLANRDPQNTWWGGGVRGIADELYLKLNNQKMVSEEETKPKLAILLHKFLLKESAYGLNRVETI